MSLSSTTATYLSPRGPSHQPTYPIVSSSLFVSLFASFSFAFLWVFHVSIKTDCNTSSSFSLLWSALLYGLITSLICLLSSSSVKHSNLYLFPLWTLRFSLISAMVIRKYRTSLNNSFLERAWSLLTSLSLEVIGPPCFLHSSNSFKHLSLIFFLFRIFDSTAALSLALTVSRYCYPISLTSFVSGLFLAQLQ